jgi:hypothetical protein
MRTEDMSDREARVYEVVARLETEGRPGYVQSIAGEADISVEEAHEVLHRLTGERGIVHELRGTEDPDPGRQYQLAPRGT